MATNLVDQIDQHLKEALKAGETQKRQVLSSLKAALTNARIAKKVAQLSDEDAVQVISREVSSRKDAAAEFRKGGAEDRAKAEEQEAALLTVYLPEQVSEQEVEQAVDAAIAQTSARAATDIGKVMGILSKKLRGRADLKQVNALVRKKLSA